MMTIKIKKLQYIRGRCYFSQLVHALYGTLKIIAVLVTKVSRDLSPSCIHFFSKLKFKTFFYF